MKTALVFAFLTASLLPAAAQGLLTTGHGLDSCTDFVQGRVLSINVETSYFDWAQGYMAGVNNMLVAAKTPGRNLGAKSEEQQKTILLAYCRAHPNETYQAAVVKMFFTFPEIVNRN
jgi:hypothetical protein